MCLEPESAAAAAITVPLEVDDDADSAIDSDNSTVTTSLASSIRNYEYLNGRRYQGYRKGEYPLPNDEQEQDRLDLLHHIFLIILDGKLCMAPVKPNPQRVLDIGTGTGIWVIDFADENPSSAEIIGTDLSPIQPTWVPPNAKFIIDDAESEWLYGPDEAFDYIHGRCLGGAISDWDKLIGRAFANTKPGGWVEWNEPEARIWSDDDTLEKAASLDKWQKLCNEAAEVFKKDITFSSTLKQRMIDAGFVDVQEKIVKVPIGPWAKDPKAKEMGKWEREHFAMAIEPYTFGFIGKILKWTEEECRVLTAQAISEVRNRSFHLYTRFFFVYGRKPEDD